MRELDVLSGERLERARRRSEMAARLLEQLQEASDEAGEHVLVLVAAISIIYQSSPPRGAAFVEEALAAFAEHMPMLRAAGPRGDG